MSGLGGQAADIDIYAREILRMRQTLNEILADATGQSVDKIARDVDRDYILEPDNALEYGLIDRVVSSRHLEPVPPGNQSELQCGARFICAAGLQPAAIGTAQRRTEAPAR